VRLVELYSKKGKWGDYSRAPQPVGEEEDPSKCIKIKLNSGIYEENRLKSRWKKQFGAKIVADLSKTLTLFFSNLNSELFELLLSLPLYEYALRLTGGGLDVNSQYLVRLGRKRDIPRGCLVGFLPPL